MTDYVIYDGDCNLCVTFTQWLAQVDRGRRFRYIPMQDTEGLQPFGITPADCELGMILINGDHPSERWQGSEAAEEIARRLPGGAGIIQAYRALPGVKEWGDRGYERIRDRRYDWFGKRSRTYYVPTALGCSDGSCGPKTAAPPPAV